MLVIPAIDLMKGKVVRLTHGDPGTAKKYEQWGTPVQVANRWKSQGAKRLHIIDIDAAIGDGENRAVAVAIAKTSGLPVQVGGGIRTVEAVERLLEVGIRHVILGSLAFSNPEAIPQIQKKFGKGSVIVALDNRRGKVMVNGWKTWTSFTILSALEKFSKLGAGRFLVTSIAKDGTLQGPDLEILREAAEYPNVEVIAAGGIGGISDLIALKSVGVEGAVVGKALYEEKFTLKQALNAVGEN